jgi:hypothetical protein
MLAVDPGGMMAARESYRIMGVPKSVGLSSQKPLRPVIIKIVLGRPVLVFTGGEDVPVSESQNVARKILLDLYPFGYEHLILVADTHQAFIERPVAEAVETSWLPDLS